MKIGVVAIVALLCLVGCGMSAEEEASKAEKAENMPVATSTSHPPPPPTVAPTPTALVWRQFTPAQISEIDERMDGYIEQEHAGAVNYADDAEMRYGMCTAMAGVDWDWGLFVESGESLVLQGMMPSEDWLLMRDLASYLMYLVQQPNMDAYMQSRRAGGLRSHLCRRWGRLTVPTTSSSHERHELQLLEEETI